MIRVRTTGPESLVHVWFCRNEKSDFKVSCFSSHGPSPGDKRPLLSSPCLYLRDLWSDRHHISQFDSPFVSEELCSHLSPCV